MVVDEKDARIDEIVGLGRDCAIDINTPLGWINVGASSKGQFRNLVVTNGNIRIGLKVNVKLGDISPEVRAILTIST
jgi:hypothetical protein